MQVKTMSEGTKRVVIAHLVVDGDSMAMPRRVVRQLSLIPGVLAVSSSICSGALPPDIEVNTKALDGLWVIHAPSQVEDGSDPQFEGYWSCEYGWTSFDLATRYQLWETSIDLPSSVGNDARWVMQTR